MRRKFVVTIFNTIPNDQPFLPISFAKEAVREIEIKIIYHLLTHHRRKNFIKKHVVTVVFDDYQTNVVGFVMSGHLKP